MATHHPTDRDAFGHWLSGFTDGEGCFNLSYQRYHNRKTRVRHCQATFTISLRADDAAILQDIQQFWGCGRIYSFKNVRTRGREKPAREFRIGTSADLHNIVVPHFLQYPLRAKKSRDFTIWAEGVALLFNIRSKVKRWRKNNRGTLPLWTETDERQFADLALRLKKQRTYAADIVPLPPPPVPERGLFS